MAQHITIAQDLSENLGYQTRQQPGDSLWWASQVEKMGFKFRSKICQ